MSQSSNRTHVTLSLEKSHDAEPRRLLHFLLSAVPYIKHAVVVDDDVDVHDPQDIEWALSTRFQADQDLVIVADLPARSIDPSKKEGNLTTKAGLDATVPISQRERFKRIAVPSEVRDKVAKSIANILRGSDRG
jgi:2,5-furandicarboxylate decarboxylase 1